MIDHVRTTIIEYLGGRFPVDEFAMRLPDPWELDEAHAGDAASELTMRVVGLLAEMEAGDRSEVELRGALTTLVALPEQSLGAMKGDVDAWADPASQRAGTALQAEYA